jgi:hypothetical protein
MEGGGSVRTWGQEGGKLPAPGLLAGTSRGGLRGLPGTRGG